jgi:hypothetical protein
MANFFIAVGGTGQMVALAYWRLHQLMPWLEAAKMYHIDKDTIEHFTNVVPSTFIDPLPAQAGATVYDHFNDPTHNKMCDDILDTLFTSSEQKTEIKTGMYGHPPVGSSVIIDRLRTGNDGILAELLSGNPNSPSPYLKDGGQHTVVICGSAMGGTGAGGVPSIAQYIDQQLANNRANIKIYVFYFLKHFELPAAGAKNINSDQITTNAKSGMCYLTDKIAKGADGCLMMGLNVSPIRRYEDVGGQTEQSHALHILAAMYAHWVCRGGTFPAKHNAHGIENDWHDDGFVAKNIGIEVLLKNGKTVGLDRLIQLNVAVRAFLIRLSRFINPPPKFAFVPPIPRELRRALKRLTKQTNEKLETICAKLSTQLLAKAQEIEKIIEWYEEIYQKKTAFSLQPVTELDGKAYKKAKISPMSVIREWCKNIKSHNDDITALVEMLTIALYRSLDKTFFNEYFGTYGE